MSETPENWPYHHDGTPYACELCDLIPYECQCPNGPWRDIDDGVQWLLGEHNLLTVEIEQLQKRLDVAGYEREADRQRVEFFVGQLVRIRGFLHTEDVVLPSGKRYAFKPPDNVVREAWEGLSQAIRDIQTETTKGSDHEPTGQEKQE